MLPENQIAALREGVQAHEQRVADLERAIRVAEEEIVVQRMLIELAQDDQLTSALGELYASPTRAWKDPRDLVQYWREQGIILPDGATLQSVSMRDDSTSLTLRLLYGEWELEVRWDSERGFAVRPRTSEPYYSYMMILPNYRADR